MRVNQLSVEAEVFYRRCMSIVDDYGRTEAMPELLLARLFPLKLSIVTATDIRSWTSECVQAGLLLLYVVQGKHFLELIDFNQQIRAKQSKCPAPNEGRCVQMFTDVGALPTFEQQPVSSCAQLPEAAHLGEDEDGVEVVSEGEGEGEESTDKPSAPAGKTDAIPFAEIVATFNETFGTQCRMTNRRRGQLRTRWKDAYWRENWRQALARAGPSKFLRGENARGWRIGLDKFLEPDTVTEILEGKFDNRDAAVPSAGSAEPTNASIAWNNVCAAVRKFDPKYQIEEVKKMCTEQEALAARAVGGFVKIAGRDQFTAAKLKREFMDAFGGLQ